MKTKAAKTKVRKKHKLQLWRVNKLSALLEIGLRDLKKQEIDKNRAVDMGLWWRPKSEFNPVCEACLAGSVMAHSLGKPPGCESRTDIGPTDYGRRTEARLLALDYLRMGNVPEAAYRIGTTTTLGYRVMPDYECPEDWWDAAQQLLADLRKAGE